jgi:hypothetical protein
MGLPGLIGSQVPDGPDAVWRDLSALRSQLQQVQAQIGSAQALITLANDQIVIQNQQLALAANQVSPSVGSASASLFVTTTSYATYATFNLTVPAGYTKALITVSGFASSSTSATGGDEVNARTLCNGIAGSVSVGVIYNSTASANVSAYGAYNLAGLTAGQTIPVELQLYLRFGPSPTVALSRFDTANVVASALFQK